MLLKLLNRSCTVRFRSLMFRLSAVSASIAVLYHPSLVVPTAVVVASIEVGGSSCHCIWSSIDGWIASLYVSQRVPYSVIPPCIARLLKRSLNVDMGSSAFCLIDNKLQRVSPSRSGDMKVSVKSFSNCAKVP